MIRTAFFMLCLGFAFPNFVSAQINVDLDADDRGWYREDGFHESDNENYLTGIFDLTGVRSDRNSFFVFDLVDIQVVESASLRLFLPSDGYNSADSDETFSVFDFDGDLTDLVDGAGGIAAYDNLGDGLNFGSIDIEAANENSFIDIELNADGIAFLNARAGDFAVLGGSITSLNSAVGASGNEFVFGETETVQAPQLLLVAVPEPSSIALIGLAFAAISSRRRRLV